MKEMLKSAVYAAVDKIQRARFAGKMDERTEHRAVAWGYRRRPPPHIMTTRNGVKMHFDQVDYIPLLLDYVGSFEPHCLAVADILISSQPGEGHLVLDVGGNIGAHALQFASALGVDGTVVTVEAMPFHAQSIQRNIALNRGLAKIDVRNVAVGAADGVLSLALPADGNGGCYSAGSTADASDRFEVPMTTIDGIMGDYPEMRLALLKMDIEGSETSALEGAEHTFDTHRPHTMIELNEAALAACGSSTSAVKAFFEERQYLGFLIGRDAKGAASLDHLPQDRAHVTDEVLFVHAARLDEFLGGLRRHPSIKIKG